MTAESEVQHGRHCVFNLHVHLVFAAKYRRRVFDGPAIERLREIFAAVCRDFEARAATSRNGTGRACCGAPATSPRPAVAPRSPSCASTSSSSSDRTESGEWGIEPRPPGRYPPRPERRGLSRIRVICASTPNRSKGAGDGGRTPIQIAGPEGDRARRSGRASARRALRARHRRRALGGDARAARGAAHPGRLLLVRGRGSRARPARRQGDLRAEPRRMVPPRRAVRRARGPQRHRPVPDAVLRDRGRCARDPGPRQLASPGRRGARIVVSPPRAAPGPNPRVRVLPRGCPREHQAILGGVPDAAVEPRVRPGRGGPRSPDRPRGRARRRGVPAGRLDRPVPGAARRVSIRAAAGARSAAGALARRLPCAGAARRGPPAGPRGRRALRRAGERDPGHGPADRSIDLLPGSRSPTCRPGSRRTGHGRSRETGRPLAGSPPRRTRPKSRGGR